MNAASSKAEPEHLTTSALNWIRPELRVIGPIALLPVAGSAAVIILFVFTVSYNGGVPTGALGTAISFLPHFVVLVAALILSGTVGEDSMRELQDATTTSSRHVAMRRWFLVAVVTISTSVGAGSAAFLTGSPLNEVIRTYLFLAALVLCVTATAATVGRLLGSGAAAAPVSVAVWLAIELVWVRALGTGSLSASGLLAAAAVILVPLMRTENRL